MVAKARKPPVIIGVTGGSGSGKTTVSQAVFNQLAGHSVLMLQEDSYYNDQAGLTMEQRLQVNYDHPNAFDTPLLIKQLSRLLDWKSVQVPVYDYTAHTRSKQVRVVEPQEVIIVL
jgi:uridine kinase